MNKWGTQMSQHCHPS